MGSHGSLFWVHIKSTGWGTGLCPLQCVTFKITLGVETQLAVGKRQRTEEHMGVFHRPGLGRDISSSACVLSAETQHGRQSPAGSLGGKQELP